MDRHEQATVAALMLVLIEPAALLG